MSCSQWKDDWVACLYDELEPSEALEASEHLDRCADCRLRLDELRTARRFLKSCASAVPEPRRLVVLERPTQRPMWAFVGGLAAASLVFAVGLAVGRQSVVADPVETGRFTHVPSTAPATATDLQGADPEARFQELLDRVEQRLAALEIKERSPSYSGDAALTRASFLKELDRLERRVDRRRARDLDLMLQAVAATEIRTGTWIDETREALQMLALEQDPRISEQ